MPLSRAHLFIGGHIYAILVEGIMRNNSVRYFEFGPVVQEVI